MHRFLIAVVFVLSIAAGRAEAATAEEIDARVDAALDQFREVVDGGGTFLESAKGVLVFPRVIKAGIGVGGEYGEGALRIDGRTVQYYSTAAASIGLQLGAQAKTIVIVFLEEQALERFRRSDGWEVGIDGSVALVEIGAGAELTTKTLNNPIIGFVFGQKGLMYNLTLEGSKFTKIVR
jgi:lipid-binding SYLF domain-containing protein